MIQRIMDNLLWLHDQIDPVIRARSKLWYDGAEQIAEKWSLKYGILKSQAAGMLAVLSPQKDWFMNVTMAERVIDILYGKMDYQFDSKMRASSFQFLLKEGSKDVADQKNMRNYDLVKGKTLREAIATNNQEAIGLWIRAYDEAYHSSEYAIIHPEGDFGANKTTLDGVESSRAWGGFDALGKAASIFIDGSPENINAKLGGEHKVRNFYNNIFNPSDPRFATIDTHAVAAALLTPFGGSDRPVAMNFGKSGGSNETGVSGTYPIYLEAYKRAAEARGILPREMQSITWEAIRGMFKDTFKTKDNQNAIKDIWDQVDRGALTREEALTQVRDMAGGIDHPDWWGGHEQTTVVSRDKSYVPDATTWTGRKVAFSANGYGTALTARLEALPYNVHNAIVEEVARSAAMRAFTAFELLADQAKQERKEAAFRKVFPEMGVNVANDTVAGVRYADLLADGKKVYETRETDSLRPYVGKIVAIVRTGEGTAKAIGTMVIGEPIKVDAEQFRAMRDQHLVPEGSEFDVKAGGEKYLYPITEAKRFDQEHDVGRGIVARRVQYPEPAKGTGKPGSLLDSFKGKLQVVVSGYLDTTGPGFSLQMTKGASMAKIQELAKVLGYALRQDEIQITSPESFKGGKEMGTVQIHIPKSMFAADIEALYSEIRSNVLDGKGKELLGGHTTEDGTMAIIVPHGTELALSNRIAEYLGDRHDVTSDSLFVESLTKGKKDYGLPGQKKAGGGFTESSLGQYASRIRESVDADFETRIAAAEEQQLRSLQGDGGVLRQAFGRGEGGVEESGNLLAPTPWFVEYAASKGKAAPSFQEVTTDPQSFHDAITASKAANPNSASVYVYSVEEYAGMRTFLAEGGKAGVALKGDDIVSVFNADPNLKGASLALIRLAVDHGGRKLDAFDTTLPRLYAEAGFRIVSRLSWDETQKPDGWNKELYSKFANGEPDVVFMVYDPARAGQPGVYAKDYSQAVAMQTASVKALSREFPSRLTKEQTRLFQSGDTNLAALINPINNRFMGPLYEVLPTSQVPASTRTAYKLMEIRESRPGIVLPLYAKPEGQKQGFTTGQWYKAENQRPSIGSKQLAERPGIHGVNLPVFDQGKASVKGSQRVWVEVEIPVIRDRTQAESDSSTVLANGMRSGITGRLIDANESYDYKTNPSASGDAGGWPIAGSMKVRRIMSDAEVETMLRENGLDHQVENSMTGVDRYIAEVLNHEMERVGNKVSGESETLRQGNRGFYDSESLSVGFLKAANPSTAIHEGWHFFFDYMVEIAKGPDAPPDIVADVGKMFDYLGVKSMEEWASLKAGTKGSNEYQRWVAAHEKMAESGEEYVMTGNFPITGLRSIFSKFKEWMVETYKNLEKLNVKLTPEIREVFDRMVGQDDIVLRGEYAEIAKAKTGKEIIPGFAAEQVALQPYPDMMPTSKFPYQIAMWRMNTNSDYEAAIMRIQEVNESTIKGPKSWKEADYKAAEMAGDAFYDGNGRDVGAMMDKLGANGAPVDEVYRAKVMLVQLAVEDQVMQRKAILAKWDAGFNVSLEEQISYLTSIDRTHMVFTRMIEERAAIGRALNQMKQFGKFYDPKEIIGDKKLFQTAKERIDAELQTRLDELMQDYRKRFGPDLTVELIARLDDKNQTLRDQKKFVESALSATSFDKWVEYWKGWGLLSGPWTTVVNVVGTSAHMWTRPFVDLIAAGVGKFTSSSEHLNFRDPLIRMAGMLDAVVGGAKIVEADGVARNAYKRAFEAVKSDGASMKLDVFAGATQGRMGEVARFPFRLMSAGDTWTQHMYRAGEMQVLASHQAIGEGMRPGTKEYGKRVAELVMNPDEAMAQAGDLAAARHSFNEAKGGYGMAAVLNYATNQIPVLNLVFPFKRTPINVLDEMLRLTPLAPFISKTWREAYNSGGIARDRAVAEALLGTTLFGLTVSFAAAGNVTGNGPVDPGKRQAWLAVNQPYSVKINNAWYSYARIQPVGTLLGMAADVFEVSENLTKEEGDHFAKMVAVAFANAITNQTFLKGLSDFTNAMSDPDRYGAKYAQNIISSQVPSIIAQTAAMSDDNAREIYSIVDAVKYRIWGLRQTLEPKIDYLGQNVPSPERALYVLPVVKKPIPENAAAIEGERLGVKVPKIPKKFHVGKNTGKLGDVELTPEERTRYAEESGRLANEMLNQMVTSPSWTSIPETTLMEKAMKRQAFHKLLEVAHKYGATMAVDPQKRSALLQDVMQKFTQPAAQ